MGERMEDPDTRSFTGAGWRACGAYVDPSDAIPGPGKSKLHRVGNKLYAYAWFQHRVPTTIREGMTAILALTVSEVSVLKSALVFVGAPGRPELRIDWTTSKPRTATLIGLGTSYTGEGWVTPIGRDFWRIRFQLTSETPDPVHLMPTFYIARGVENAGLDLGLHAGDAHFEVTQKGPRGDGISGGDTRSINDTDSTGAAR